MTDDSDEPDTRPENGPLDTMGQLRAAGIPVTGAAPVDWRDVARGELQKRIHAPPTRPGYSPPSKPARPRPLTWGVNDWNHVPPLAPKPSHVDYGPGPPISRSAEQFAAGHGPDASLARLPSTPTMFDLLFRIPESSWCQRRTT